MSWATRTIAIAVLVGVTTLEFGGQASPGGRLPTLTYNIRDLGTLGGPSSVALGVNDKGQVVGSADTAQGLRHAYLWENGEMIDLGTLGYPPPAQSGAWDINNQGVVVGTVGGGDPNKAFIWENGVQTELGNPQVLKSAYGINDARQVVGIYVVAPSGDQHAFLWENGTMTDLGTLGGTFSIAWDINENGQIVGGSSVGSSPGGAFLWENGTMTNLGTLGGAGSGAFDLNDVGMVVGWAQRTAEKNALFHAFLWENAVMTDLGAMLGAQSSSAEAINDHGEVVGLAVFEGGGSFHGFIYDPQYGMNLLEDMIPPNSGWSVLVPRDINNAGWIVGAATGPAGRHAFLMTPAIVIPTVSGYGTVVMTMLILTCGTILIARARGLRGQAATLHQRTEKA